MVLSEAKGAQNRSLNMFVKWKDRSELWALNIMSKTARWFLWKIIKKFVSSLKLPTIMLQNLTDVHCLTTIPFGLHTILKGTFFLTTYVKIAVMREEWLQI